MGIKEIVLNWIKKADSDLKTAKDEIITKEPATDTICLPNLSPKKVQQNTQYRRVD